jgi:hypothetical protein
LALVDPLMEGEEREEGSNSLQWRALVDDLRTLPPGQIAAGIPYIGELSLLTGTNFSG